MQLIRNHAEVVIAKAAIVTISQHDRLQLSHDREIEAAIAYEQLQSSMGWLPPVRPTRLSQWGQAGLG